MKSSQLTSHRATFSSEYHEQMVWPNDRSCDWLWYPERIGVVVACWVVIFFHYNFEQAMATSCIMAGHTGLCVTATQQEQPPWQEPYPTYSVERRPSIKIRWLELYSIDKTKLRAGNETLPLLSRTYTDCPTFVPCWFQLTVLMYPVWVLVWGAEYFSSVLYVIRPAIWQFILYKLLAGIFFHCSAKL